MAVRERAGLFDVSHMGEIEIAARTRWRLCSAFRVRLHPGCRWPGAVTRPDDRASAPSSTICSSTARPSHFMLVVNASHIAEDYKYIAEQIAAIGNVVAVDASSRYALLAVQGPRALDVLQPLTGLDLASMKYYWFANGEVASVRAMVSRTGYTGEDGFEIFVPPQSADRVWQA